jgi:hypothetical protein
MLRNVAGDFGTKSEMYRVRQYVMTGDSKFGKYDGLVFGFIGAVEV